jgi:hypothetical protein
MLLRETDRGVLAIGQPSHAWLSGQLARAWGNERFGTVEPFEEVCLAAEQHDVGWAVRDLEPLYHADNGRPRQFTEMPLEIHLELFTEGPQRLLSQSRYAALLVSMHGRRLYERRDLDRMSASEAERVRAFLERQQTFQAQLLALLRADPRSAALAADELVERNSLLVWTWDYLSLAICLEWLPASAKGCPTAGEPVDLQLSSGSAASELRLDPWPFSAGELTVHCEGRRLEPRYDDAEALRCGFDRAQYETLQIRLVPG